LEVYPIPKAALFALIVFKDSSGIVQSFSIGFDHKMENLNRSVL